MAFMKRDVNLGLLGLIIASILLFSGFTVYYHTTFQNVSMEYQNKLERLQEVSQKLEQQKEELNKTYSLRVKAEQDVRTLDARFQDLQEENKGLKGDISTLETDLTQTKDELAETKAELTATSNRLASTQEELANAQSQVSVLESRVDSLGDDLDEVCADYETATGNEHPEC